MNKWSASIVWVAEGHMLEVEVRVGGREPSSRVGARVQRALSPSYVPLKAGIT